MSTTDLKVCVEALSLPRKARADLAHRLLVSLEDENTDPKIDEAWKNEAERRFANLKKGRTTARDAKQAIADARKKLRK